MLMILSVAILNVVGMAPNVQLAEVLMYTAHSGPTHLRMRITMHPLRLQVRSIISCNLKPKLRVNLAIVNS